MKFSYSDVNYDQAPAGVYLAQVIKASSTKAKASGNPMITLSLRTIPNGYSLPYYLTGDGLVTQFCKRCEGELAFPADPNDEYSLTPADALFRLVFIEVVHESNGADEPRAKIKLGGLLSRAEALARNPSLAKVKSPANTPAPKPLAIIPAGGKGSAPGLPDDDDVPF